MLFPKLPVSTLILINNACDFDTDFSQAGGPIAVVQDGDIVTISAETNTLSMDVSDEEIASRLKAWKPPKSAVNRGVLAKYARLVGDASHGAMTDLF